MSWAETGRPLDEFWGLTFFEIDICLRANSKTIEKSWAQTSWTVWRLAWLMRVKRLPRKPDELFKTRSKNALDWKRQKQLIEVFNGLMSGSDQRSKEK